MALMNVNQIGSAQFTQSEWFVARITSVATTSSGSGACSGYKHGWIEQRVCANGIAYEDADVASAEEDEDLASPAYPITGVNAAVNDLVLMRTRGIDTSGNTIYEFLPKGGGTAPSSGYVTSVQCTSGLLSVTYD